jgi:putative adenylate-forming enzyme
MIPMYTFLRGYYYGSTPRRFQSTKQLKEWQNKRRNEVLNFVRTHTQFYSEIRTPLSWEEIPIMNKDLMLENFNGIVSLAIEHEEARKFALNAEVSRIFSKQLKGATVGLSSGTTGGQGIFLVSELERAEWAGYMLGKFLLRLPIFKQKIALFLRSNSKLYESVNVMNVKFQYYDLREPFENLSSHLGNWQPDIIVAPPEVFCELIDRGHNAAVHERLGRIISAANVLDPKDKEYIGNAFALAVDEIYQATEGFIASTCSAGSLHLNEDVVYLEEDKLDDTRYIPIITDFRRRFQPMIRFRLNDVLIRKDGICSCGSVFRRIEAIEGRSDDIVIGLSNESEVKIFPDFLRNAVLAVVPDVKDYKIVQSELLKLQLSGCMKEGREFPTTLVRAAIARVFTERGCAIPTIEKVNWVESPLHSKRRRVMNEMVG